MGILSSEAIILQTYPLKETDKVVVAYTRKYGKMRGVARGSRRIRSRFSGRLEPLSWVELVAFERRHQELVSIDKVELLKGFGLAMQDYQAYLRSFYLLELLVETIPDHEANDSLFRLLLHVLPLLGSSEGSRLASLYFQIWHLKLAGLLPNLSVCGSCGAVLGRESSVYYQWRSPGFHCHDCRKEMARPISGGALELAHLSIKKSLPDLAGQGVAPDAVTALSAVVEEMVETGFERKFDSLSLLRRESGHS
jgi:DNA repair protein RecO (recombination protein O)